MVHAKRQNWEGTWSAFDSLNKAGVKHFAKNAGQIFGVNLLSETRYPRMSRRLLWPRQEGSWPITEQTVLVARLPSRYLLVQVGTECYTTNPCLAQSAKSYFSHFLFFLCYSNLNEHKRKKGLVCYKRKGSAIQQMSPLSDRLDNGRCVLFCGREVALTFWQCYGYERNVTLCLIKALQQSRSLGMAFPWKMFLSKHDRQWLRQLSMETFPGKFASICHSLPAFPGDAKLLQRFRHRYQLKTGRRRLGSGYIEVFGYTIP